MTYKWLNLGQDPPRIPEFYTLTKIHKPVTLSSRRPIVSGSGDPTERISSFCWFATTTFKKKTSHTSTDTTHFINVTENAPLPEEAVLVTLDVCSLYLISPPKRRNYCCFWILRKEFQIKTTDPDTILGRPYGTVTKENYFKFNDKNFLQSVSILSFVACC